MAQEVSGKVNKVCSVQVRQCRDDSKGELMDFAFEEFWALLNRSKPEDSHKITNYLCALVAELAYYHVPQFEFDAPKRAKLVVPSDGYQHILLTGAKTDVVGYLRRLDFGRSFVVVDRGIVAVGVVARNKLFIGFRGTAFLFDWRINLAAPLVPVGAGSWGPGHSSGVGRIHRGFAEEAMRISQKVIEEWKRLGHKPMEEVYLSGHSLGGAVAAISEDWLGRLGHHKSTCLLGSPRYADVGYYYSRSRYDEPPLQIRNSGDIVPSVPPRKMGYADHPREYDTSGNPWLSAGSSRASYFLWRAALFIGKGFASHKIERYREELGETCGAKFARNPFTDYQKLTKEDVHAPA